MTAFVVSKITQMIADTLGMSVRLVAGETIEIVESLLPAALAAGAEQVNGDVNVGPALTADDVAVAIRKLMAEGTSGAFAANGEPKLVALRKVLGAGVTDALRDAGWAIVKAEV